jgi:hypothetical protein
MSEINKLVCSLTIHSTYFTSLNVFEVSVFIQLLICIVMYLVMLFCIFMFFVIILAKIHVLSHKRLGKARILNSHRLL